MRANPRPIPARPPRRSSLPANLDHFGGGVHVVSHVFRIGLGISILRKGRPITQEAAAAGLRVQLLRDEHPETGAASALLTCTVLVAAGHEPDMRKLPAAHGC